MFYKTVFTFVVFVCLLSQWASCIPNWNEPSFCNGLNCPQFKVTYKNQSLNYEERTYIKSRWVSTKIESTEFDKSMRTGFMRLFSYIQGKNEQNKKIKMTAPVLTKIIPGAGPACKSTFIVSFYLPYQYQPSMNNANATAPPKPANDDVYIEERPHMKIALVSFGGYVRSFDKVIEHYNNLVHYAKKNGHQIKNPNQEYIAQYDSPFRIFDRHNEVWTEIQ